MMANVEQIGLEEERQRKGERRQTAQLALCQQYQDMSTERNLPLHSALTLVAVSVLCVGITCEDRQSFTCATPAAEWSATLFHL